MSESLFRTMARRLLAVLNRSVLHRMQVLDDRLTAGLDSRDAELAAARRQIDALRARLDHVENRPQPDIAGLASQVSTLARTVLRNEELTIANATRGMHAFLSAEVGATPRFSILLPTYNRARHVVEAVRSVVAQDWQSWELIIVDDGSTDGTPDALTPFLADPRVQLIIQANRGSSAARKRAFEAARGEFIAMLDSDNLFVPGYLGLVADFFQRHPETKIAYGGLVSDIHAHGGSRILLREFDHAALLQGNYIDTNTIIARRDFMKERAAFDSLTERLNDWELMLCLTGDGTPAQAMPILATVYRRVDDIRLSDRGAIGPDQYDVRAKWLSRPAPDVRLRVLCVICDVDTFDRTDIGVEIATMVEWGVEIGLWHESSGEASHLPGAVMLSGPLDEAMAAFAPMLVHVHCVDKIGRVAELAGDTPVTVRSHGMALDDASLDAMARHRNVQAVYVLPHRAAGQGGGGKVKPQRPLFLDARPLAAEREDGGAVLLLTDGDIAPALAFAGRFPALRFLLLDAGKGRNRADMRQAPAGSADAEIVADPGPVRRTELLDRIDVLLELPSGSQQSAARPPLLLQAMARGVYPIVSNRPEYADCLGAAGARCETVDEAAEALAATLDWTPADRREAACRSINQAYLYHGPKVELRSLHADWLAIAGSSQT